MVHPDRVEAHDLAVLQDLAEGLHPFTVTLMRALMPNNRMLLAIEKYNGSTDLDEHLRSFIDAMVVYASNDLISCKVFSLSLKGEALAWFHSLELDTIDGFGTLCNLLGQQYASNRTQGMTYPALVKIRQGKKETLKEFMDWFN